MSETLKNICKIIFYAGICVGGGYLYGKIAKEFDEYESHNIYYEFKNSSASNNYGRVSRNYGRAIKAIAESDMYSCDKEKVIDLINNNEPSDFYEGIISIANSDMFSCDKRDVIKKMCGESE